MAKFHWTYRAFKSDSIDSLSAWVPDREFPDVSGSAWVDAVEMGDGDGTRNYVERWTYVD